MESRLIRLWTWQRKGFSITDGNVQVDSRNHSNYLSGDYSSTGFKDAYETLWSIVRTDQFHWYYTAEKGAREPQNVNQEKVLWSVEAPEEAVLCTVCAYAWMTLAHEGTGTPPDWSNQAYHVLKKLNIEAGGKPYLRGEYARDFTAGWSEMRREVLPDCLRVPCSYAAGCTQVLLRHPIPREWVVKEPEEYSQAISSASQFESE